MATTKNGETEGYNNATIDKVRSVAPLAMKDTALDLHKCDVCHKEFRNRGGYASHKKQKHGIDSRQKKKKQMNDRIREQKRLRWKNRAKTIPCGYCEKMFKTNAEKKTHERQHTGEKPYTCNNCESTFTNPTTRNNHMRNCQKFDE